MALDIYTMPNALNNQGEVKDRNTNDVITDIFIAAQEEVREMVTNVLNNSARSIPLFLPIDPPELCLWQFKNIVKTWQSGKSFEEKRIFDHKCPIVSFIKIGDVKNLSKSLSINKAFFDQNFQVFRDRRSTGKQLELLHKGMIDIAWTEPKTNTIVDENDEGPADP